jgi:hypothetical protein
LQPRLAGEIAEVTRLRTTGVRNRRLSREVSSAISMVEAAMPAKSKAQQKAAGAALSAKRGETPKSELRGASREMVNSMSEKQLEDFAKGSRKGKPEHVADKR